MRKSSVIVAVGLLLAACATTPQGTKPHDTEVAAAPALSQVRAITDLKQAEALAATLPRASTLVVFDIDDTLLTAPDLGTPTHPQFFGSDRWYVWQSKELKPGDPDRIGCLFEVIALNYEAATQKPTQADAPAVVARMANDRLILTARSPDYRGATERELAKAGFAPLPSLASEDALMVRAPAGGYMTYANGILMTRGANKGDALLALLDRIGRSYANVILVDDGEKNIQAMQTALAGRAINYYGLRYEGIKTDPPPPVTPAQIEESRVAVRAWSQLLDRLYPQRKARYQAECAAGADGL
jgi:Protein of unknown function (DUF2608)